MIVDHGSIETPSEICETPISSHAESRRKERKRENQKKRRLKEKSKIDCEGNKSPILVTTEKTDGICSTLSGSITQHNNPDMEDVFDSDKGKCYCIM